MRLYFTATIFLSLIIWIPGHSENSVSMKHSLIERYLKLSGIDHSLRYTAEKKIMQSSEFRLILGESSFEAYVNALRKSFQYDSLKQDIVAYYTKNYDEQKISSLIVKLQLPLFRRMIEIENEASIPANYNKIQSYIKKTDLSEFPSERIESAKAMVDFFHSALDLKEYGVRSIRTMLSSLDPFLPPEKRFNENHMEIIARQYIARYDDLIKPNLLKSFVCNYRKADIKELQEYSRMMDNDLMRWYAKSGLYAYEEIYTAAYNRVRTSAVNITAK